MDHATIKAAITTYQEATAAMADADRALADAAPSYIVKAMTYKGGTDQQRARIVKALPYLPAAEDLPMSLTPHETYGDVGLTYTVGGDPHRWDQSAVSVGAWTDTVAALLLRHPPIPVSVAKGGCTSIRPDARPGKQEERATVTPIADVHITADKIADYPHTVMLQWWTAPAPDVVIRIQVVCQGYNEATKRVRYSVTNAPKSDRVRQYPEDRQWSVSSTWGPGSARIQWASGQGNPPRVTWTWPVGTSIEDMIGEGK